MLLCRAMRMIVKASTPGSPSLVSIVWHAASQANVLVGLNGRRVDSPPSRSKFTAARSYALLTFEAESTYLMSSTSLPISL